MRRISPSRTDPAHRRRGGVALVTSLSLMGFVLLLLVSFTVFVRVESESARISLSTLHARQNALLGALVAVGELQKLAGPDQRATSPTDYSVGRPIPAGRPDAGATVNQGYWTEVWAVDHPVGARVSGSFLGWLVSGDAANPRGPSANNAALAAGNAWLVHDGSVSDPANRVQAPTSALDGRAGEFAWWVGDEGCKAALTLENPHTGTALGYRVSQKPDFSFVPGLGPAFEAHGNRTRLTRLSQLTEAGAGAAAVRDRFFDVTPLSLGVLADSARGGLRKDLTRAFTDGEDFAALKAGHPHGDLIFGPTGGVETADDPGGPRWEQLRDYYNLRPTSAGTIDLTLAGPGAPTLHHRDDQLGVYPVMSWVQIRYYLTLTTDGVSDTATKRRLKFWFLPTVMLWNPYDVDLVLPDLWVQISTDLPNATRDNLRYKWRVYNGASAVTARFGFFSGSPANDPLPLILKLEGGVVIPPGESRLFSVLGHQPVTPSASMRAGVEGNVLSPDTSVNSVDYGLSFLAANFPEFDYDPGIEYQGVITKPDAGFGDMDMNVWMATDPGFAADSMVQQINGIENSLPVHHFTTGDSPPGGNAQHCVISPLLGDPVPGTPFEEAIYARYPAIANSVMAGWTNTWESIRAFPWAALANPRSSFAGRSGYGRDEADVQNSGSIGHLQGYVHHGSTHGFINPNIPGRAWLIYRDSSEVPYVGWDYRDRLQATSMFEIPRSADGLLSVGQFTQANLSRNNGFDTDAQGNKLAWFQVGDRHLYGNLTPAYAIGNSRADPQIPLNSVAVDWSSVNGIGPAKGTHYDYSYLLNEALWDRYFVSAIPATGAIPDPLPNSRLLPNPFDRSLGISDRRSFDRAAASYLTNGVFNVNSTSVEAWRALLAGFLGAPVSLAPGGTSGGTGSAFPRFNLPLAGEFTNAAGFESSTEAYNGFRRLSEGEIDLLAEAIVDEIKRPGRSPGPFLSLSAFVNRGLDGDAGVGLKGLLQAAIDQVPINSAITDGYTMDYASSVFDTGGDPGYTVDALDGMPIAANIPGFLSQADLMARLGPALSARSDTFRIRAYGLAGRAEAWAEVWVQRLPEYVDASVPPETAVADLAPGSVNERFGRRFRILDFRWLSEGEI